MSLPPITPLGTVWIKNWTGPGGGIRYHRGDIIATRCGMVELRDATDWTEEYAFTGLNARPCGRCWFRTWRDRIAQLEALFPAEAT